VRTIACALSDQYLLRGFEILLFILVVYAMVPSRKAGISLSIKRGELSLGYLYAFYGAFFSVVFFIPLAASAQHRVLLSVLNSCAAVYLCFFNSWSRNLIISLIVRATNMVE